MKFKVFLAFACALTLVLGICSLSLGKAKPHWKPKAKHWKVNAKTKKMIELGEKVYAEKKCDMCHAIGKKGGKIGPNLMHVGKTWKPARLALMIRDSKKINKKSIMPPYGPKQINAQQLKELVAYLSCLK